MKEKLLEIRKHGLEKIESIKTLEELQDVRRDLTGKKSDLVEVLKTLGTNDVNIVALSLADTADYGMLRMIVSDPKKGKAVLKSDYNRKF